MSDKQKNTRHSLVFVYIIAAAATLSFFLGFIFLLDVMLRDSSYSWSYIGSEEFKSEYVLLGRKKKLELLNDIVHHSSFDDPTSRENVILFIATDSDVIVRKTILEWALVVPA